MSIVAEHHQPISIGKNKINNMKYICNNMHCNVKGKKNKCHLRSHSWYVWVDYLVWLHGGGGPTYSWLHVDCDWNLFLSYQNKTKSNEKIL